MREIPRERSLDSTLALRRDPYHFIDRRCHAHGTDLFEARLLLERTICMRGAKAARLFYDRERFIREGAAPGLLRKTLFGEAGVQTLDGAEHLRRKSMFLSLMTPSAIDRLAQTSAALWRASAAEWKRRGEPVALYDMAKTVLCQAVCDWAGVPLPAEDVARRTRQLTALFQYAGSVGPSHLWSRLARKQAEQWSVALIENVRANRVEVPESGALAVVAHHRDIGGNLLEVRTAAVELLNVLRPTVAVAVYVVFIADALYRHPACSRRIKARAPNYTEQFVQEVRRFYRFFPAVLARVRENFEWEGYRFPRGRRVVLDLYGTNNDSRNWAEADQFRPERFAERQPNPFDLIPQGGGEHATNHRCPGEWITIELMKTATEFLAREITYDVPPQDLEMPPARLPPLPSSGFIITNVATRLNGGG